MVFEVLGRLGLTDAEIRVYAALVESGMTTVGPLVDAAQVSSSKIYDILAKLKAKGLVSEISLQNVKRFQAADPFTLIALLEEKEREFVAQKKLLQEHVLPTFAKRTPEKASVKVYEGAEGLKMALAYILDSLDTDGYCAFSFPDISSSLPSYGQFVTFHHRRWEKGIPMRVLAPHKQKDEFTNLSLGGVDCRYSNLPIPPGVVIFKDHVANFIFGDPILVTITKSRVNYESKLAFFNGLWELADPSLAGRAGAHCVQCAHCRHCSDALGHQGS